MWIAYYEGIAESLPELRLTLPDITFSDSLWIHGKNRSLKLVEYKNGHTASDVVLIIPEAQIAFMGDLFFVDRHPWLGDGDPQQWYQILQHFKESKDIDRFVPGHGPITGKNEFQILQDYIKDVHTMVQQGFNERLPDSVILKAQVPEKYADWWFGPFISMMSDRFADKCERIKCQEIFSYSKASFGGYSIHDDNNAN